MRFIKNIGQISTVFTIGYVFIAQFTQTSNNTYTPPTLLPFKTQTHTYSKFKYKNKWEGPVFCTVPLVFIILLVNILQLRLYLSFCRFTFVQFIILRKMTNHFPGLSFSWFIFSTTTKNACGAYHFPGLSFSRFIFLLYFFRTYQFPG